MMTGDLVQFKTVNPDEDRREVYVVIGDPDDPRPMVSAMSLAFMPLPAWTRVNADDLRPATASNAHVALLPWLGNLWATGDGARYCDTLIEMGISYHIDDNPEEVIWDVTPDADTISLLREIESRMPDSTRNEYFVRAVELAHETQEA